jgi:ferredoxin
MECGACRRNCPFGAIEVDEGVGCAAAILMSLSPAKSRPAVKQEFISPIPIPNRERLVGIL